MPAPGYRAITVPHPPEGARPVTTTCVPGSWRRHRMATPEQSLPGAPTQKTAFPECHHRRPYRRGGSPPASVAWSGLPSYVPAILNSGRSVVPLASASRANGASASHRRTWQRTPLQPLAFDRVRRSRPLRNSIIQQHPMQRSASASSAYTNGISRPLRAPAVYCRLGSEGENGLSFRIPCPPSWDGSPATGWAAERRARRAYFATLDALHFGKEASQERTKLERFLDEIRHPGVRTQLEHLRRVLDFAIGGRNVAPLHRPDRPFARVQLTVPVPSRTERPEQLQARFRWTLEWLQTRGYTTARDLRIDWRLQVRPVAVGHAGGYSPSRQRHRASA